MSTTDIYPKLGSKLEMRCVANGIFTEGGVVFFMYTNKRRNKKATIRQDHQQCKDDVGINFIARCGEGTAVPDSTKKVYHFLIKKLEKFLTDNGWGCALLNRKESSNLIFLKLYSK